MSFREDTVIEKLKDFPDDVAAYACHGHLTKADFETVLIPDIADKLTRHKKLRSYTEVAPDYVREDPSAWWTDAKFDFSHLFDWERIAIVTDAEWMRRAAQFYRLFGFLIGEIRAFPTAEAGEAREWILENQQ